MLDQNDLKQISDIVGHGLTGVRKEMAEGFADVRKEMADQFAVVNNELGFVKQELRTFSHHFDERIDTLTTHVDSFMKLHQDLYQEVTMMHSRLGRLEERVDTLAHNR